MYKLHFDNFLINEHDDDDDDEYIVYLLFIYCLAKILWIMVTVIYNDLTLTEVRSIFFGKSFGCQLERLRCLLLTYLASEFISWGDTKVETNLLKLRVKFNQHTTEQLR